MAGDIVTFDLDSRDTFESLTRVIVWEMTARLAMGDRVDTPEGVQQLAELIADTVLDFFEVREPAGNAPPPLVGPLAHPSAIQLYPDAHDPSKGSRPGAGRQDIAQVDAEVLALDGDLAAAPSRLEFTDTLDDRGE